MSVLIKGMEMPTSCYDCNFSVEAYEGSGVYACVITDNCVCKGAGMRDDCPLVPVPPHGRLIDADAFFDDLLFPSKQFEQGMRELIRDAPTVIPAEETLKEATNDQNNS